MTASKTNARECCVPGCDQDVARNSTLFCSRGHYDQARRILSGVGIKYDRAFTRAQMATALKDAQRRAREMEATEGTTIEAELQREKERLLDRAQWAERLLGKVQKQVLAQGQLVETIVGAIESLEAPEPRQIIAPKDKTHSPQTAIVQLSDLHMGESDEESETHAPGYDWQVFDNELRILEKKIVGIVSHHRTLYRMDKLVMLWLGDFVCGHEVFPGQAWRTEDNAVVQVLSGMLRIADFVSALSTFFSEIEIHCVPGNHGSVRGKEPGPTSLNWDFLTYHVIRSYLRNNPRVKFWITPSWWTIQEINGFKFYLDHGATFGRRWMGIPYYGIDRAEARTFKMLANLKRLRSSRLSTFNRRNPNMRAMLEECAPHILTENLKFDYIALGHHHVPWWCEGKILNGAFSRGNYYAMKAFQSLSVPTQWLFSVHPKIGASWFYPLRLDVEG